MVFIVKKQERYRQKQIRVGRCPHCGKLCAPHYECEERRASKKTIRLLNRMVKTGFLKKTMKGQGCWFTVDNPNAEMPIVYERHDDDKRGMPRIGNQYIDWSKLILSIFTEENKPMSGEEAFEKAFRVVSDFKKQGYSEIRRGV